MLVYNRSGVNAGLHLSAPEHTKQGETMGMQVRLLRPGFNREDESVRAKGVGHVCDLRKLSCVVTAQSKWSATLLLPACVASECGVWLVLPDYIYSSFSVGRSFPYSSGTIECCWRPSSDRAHVATGQRRLREACLSPDHGSACVFQVLGVSRV